LVVPEAVPVAKPEVLITAFVTSEELHVTCVVRFNVELSLKWPVAVNCWVEPLVIVALGGVTVIDVRIAEVTSRDAVPTTPPNAAVIVAGEPTGDSPVARPALLMVATVAGVDAQVTNEVRFCWLLSPNTPVAAKLVDIVSGTLAVVGVTLMVCN
jgi:hypothetical protein